MKDRVPEGGAAAVLAGALKGVRLTQDGLEFGSAAIFELFENIPVAISVTFGPRHQIVYANNRYRSLMTLGSDPLGRDLQQVFGSFLTPAIYALRDRVLAEAQVMQVLEQPLPPRAETPLMYWDFTYLPLLDDAGVADGILAFAVDVTDKVKARKEAERRAEEEGRRAEDVSLDRARLELAVEATGLGIWEWNVETGETRWSDRQKAIWGLEPEQEATYDYWRDSIHPEDREAVLGRLDRTLDRASGGDQALIHRIVRPSGRVRWISSHGRMVYEDGTGRPLRLIGTALDVTRNKTADEALREALSSREILLREVNHRIKNSLQLVSSMLSLQSGRFEDPDVRALIHEAERRVHAVAAVHERLYRSDDFKSVDLDIFLETLCHDLEGSLAQSDDAIVVEVAAEPATISNDRAVPIALILNELLTNAIKYAYPERSGTIRVSLSNDGEGRGTLTVADDGVGLPQGFADRRQASLGFRIIEGLARQIDGEIAITDRRPGTGIAISFELAPD